LTQPQQCPRCSEPLLWNGRGMACIACAFFQAESKPPSEMKLRIPKKKKGKK